MKWREEWEWVQIDGCDYVLVPHVQGFRMLVSSTDVGIGRELAFYRVHEPLVTNLLPGFVRQGDTVLDIGANIGYYTLLLSRLVGPNGCVIAVEPHPANAHLLRLNLRLNGINNVQVVSAAVSDGEGQATLFEAEGSNWHSLHPTDRTAGKTLLVTTLTVDTLARQTARPIALVRMDIEGWELNALRGGAQTLARDCPALIVEFHPFYTGQDAVRDTLAWLRSFGYERGFYVLRADDFPWVKRPRRVWERSLSALLSDPSLLDERECFTLLLESPARS
jgi:FkbM family methyltransferase